MLTIFIFRVKLSVSYLETVYVYKNLPFYDKSIQSFCIYCKMAYLSLKGKQPYGFTVCKY